MRKGAKISCLTGLLSGGLALDIITKSLAVRHLALGGPAVLIRGIFELRYAENRAVAFSLLEIIPFGVRIWLIRALSFAVLTCLAVLVIRWRRRSALELAPLMLVLGGALGNFYDRMVRGYVIDFLHLHYQAWSWPIFNVADILIDVGVGLFVLITWRGRTIHREPSF